MGNDGRGKPFFHDAAYYFALRNLRVWIGAARHDRFAAPARLGLMSSGGKSNGYTQPEPR